MTAQHQHYVEFFSPGTFTAEVRRVPVPEHDIEKAVEMSRTVLERHNAKPYAFQFVTRAREADELDAKETFRSPTYFLGGTKLTLADIEARKNAHDTILIDNMRGNSIPAVIENTNSWLVTVPFHVERGDVILPY